MKTNPIIYLVVISILTIDPYVGHSQAKLGLRLGGNFASWNSDLEDLTLAELGDMTGGHFGPYVKITAADRIAIEPAILASLKGATVHTFETGTENGETVSLEEDSDVYLLYLDFPVLIRFYLVQGLNIYAGPQISFHIANTVETVYTECISQMCFTGDEDDEAEVTGTDFAAVFGLGYEFPFGLNFTAGYDLGLSNIDDSGSFEVNNHVLKLSLGWTF